MQEPDVPNREPSDPHPRGGCRRRSLLAAITLPRLSLVGMVRREKYSPFGEPKAAGNVAVGATFLIDCLLIHVPA